MLAVSDIKLAGVTQVLHVAHGAIEKYVPVLIDKWHDVLAKKDGVVKFLVMV